MAKTDWKLSDVVKPEDMNSIGEEINNLQEEIDNIDIPPASLTQAGIVQLSSATNSDAEDLAATPKAVKSAYDAGIAAQVTANAANSAAAAAQNTANAANSAAAAAQATANQAFQAGNERKAEVVAALVAKGIPASTNDSWDTLLSKMTGIIKATGNATPADLLTGKTASNASGPITGTMPNRGAGGTVTPSTANQSKPAGYYSSPITVLGDADLVPGNIRSGVDLFGVVGSIQPRHYASGPAPLVGNARFTYFGGTSGLHDYTTVSNLGFKPYLVLMVYRDDYITIYKDDLSFRGYSGADIIMGRVTTATAPPPWDSVRMTTPAYVQDGSFQMPFAVSAVSAAQYWAFG